jgi:hypothetical protein
VDEKEVILKNLRNIFIHLKRECVTLLNDFSISTKILCFLPKHDKNDMNIAVANEILSLLIEFSKNLFCGDDKNKCNQFRSKLGECDCFNTLLFLLNIYENISLKVQISFILEIFINLLLFLRKEK